MAMTTPTPDRNGAQAAGSSVARAATALRAHTDAGWIDARDRIRSAAMSATRRTWPLALARGDDLFVSDQVVIALLRETIDAVDHVTASRIIVSPRNDMVDLVTIEVSVSYGHPIPPLVDELRRRCAELLARLLEPEHDGSEPPIDVGVVSVTVI